MNVSKKTQMKTPATIKDLITKLLDYPKDALIQIRVSEYQLVNNEPKGISYDPEDNTLLIEAGY